ncbi:Phospholipase/carboxylesterase [Clavulina sp. PMI_390]|nr:Phospholipase/carboxylesterase [Clavulina sp. PMI_390]
MAAAAIAPIILPVKRLAPHTATVIFLHGLGDTGKGWQPIADHLSKSLDHIKWVLPTAPVRQVTFAGGFPMNAWFDILETISIDRPEDDEGIKAAAKNLDTLIEAEIAAGIPVERIVIGGFSQGGATSLYTGLTTKHDIAGTVALSTWIPARNTVPSISDTAKKGRYFLAHGEDDEVVSFKFGEATADLLTKKYGIPAEADEAGRGISFHRYSDMGHNADPREIEALTAWLKKAIP